MFKHTEQIAALLRQGKRAEARMRRDRYWDEQLARAKAGEVIDLSDLLAGDEAFVIDDIEKAEGVR
jgi:hypothetical protein